LIASHDGHRNWGLTPVISQARATEATATTAEAAIEAKRATVAAVKKSVIIVRLLLGGALSMNAL
jgi:hypothetical protein